MVMSVVVAAVSCTHLIQGHIDGDRRKEARFNQPMGIVYDEETRTFYIGERDKMCIRDSVKSTGSHVSCNEQLQITDCLLYTSRCV